MPQKKRKKVENEKRREMTMYNNTMNRVKPTWKCTKCYQVKQSSK